MLVCAGVLQIVLGTTLALTHLPLCDEGFYGVGAHQLTLTGSLRNPVIESAGVEYLRGIDQVFYWIVPLAMVLQAAVFKVFGFGLLIQRLLSVVCGLGAVLLWYSTLRHLVRDRVAALAALMLSADFVFLSLSSRGRADMISLFFAMAALAGYMHFRERRLGRALAVASMACALSGLTHPNGGIAALLSCLVLTLLLDRARLRWIHLAVVAACFASAAVVWGLFIARAPDLFAVQFLGNVASRLDGPMSVRGLLKGEVSRYLAAWGLDGARGAKLVRYLLPIADLAAILYCALSKDLRRRSRILLLMFVAVSLSLAFLEGAKQGWYLVHLTPLFAAFLAISVHHLWESGRLLTRMVAGAQAAIVLLGVASIVYTASTRSLQTLYTPAVAFLNSNVGPQDLVMARSEFYFGLQCRACLRDDVNLGAVSGLRADFIVFERDYDTRLQVLRQTNPAMYQDLERRLATEYREVFRNAPYRVLQKNTISP